MGDSDEEEPCPEDEYVVESIKEIKWDEEKNDVSYLIHWRGYRDDDETWEPEENLSNAQEMVDQFAARKIQLLARHRPKIKPCPASRRSAPPPPATSPKVKENKHKSSVSSDSDDDDSGEKVSSTSKKRVTAKGKITESPVKKGPRSRAKSSPPPPAAKSPSPAASSDDESEEEVVKRKAGPKSRTSPVKNKTKLRKSSSDDEGSDSEAKKSAKKPETPEASRKSSKQAAEAVKGNASKRLSGPRSRRTKVDSESDKDSSSSEEKQQSVGKKRKRSDASSDTNKKSKKMASSGGQEKSYLSESSSSSDAESEGNMDVDSEKVEKRDKKQSQGKGGTVPQDKSAAKETDSLSRSPPPPSSSSSSSSSSSDGAPVGDDEISLLKAQLQMITNQKKVQDQEKQTPAASPSSRTAASKPVPTVPENKSQPLTEDKNKNKKKQRPHFQEEDDDDDDDDDDDLAGLGLDDGDGDKKMADKKDAAASDSKKQPSPQSTPVSSRTSAAAAAVPVVKSAKKEEIAAGSPAPAVPVVVHKLKKQPEKRAIDCGAVPEKIIACAAVCGEVVFLMQFKGMSLKQAEVVTLNEVRDKYSAMVIQYFQQRVVLVDIDENDQAMKCDLKCNQKEKDPGSSPAADNNAKPVPPAAGTPVAKPTSNSLGETAGNGDDDDDDLADLAL